MINIHRLTNRSKDIPTMDFAFIPPVYGVEGFWLQTTPVTVQQWCAVMGGSCGEGEANLPKTRVNIDDINKFLQRLKEDTQQEFRLPTELEWCRAVGVEPERLEDYAVYDAASICSVKTKLPNEYGLYDMRGLVYEWMEVGEEYVLRGGSWLNSRLLARAVYRHYARPALRVINVGFRVVLVKE